MHDARGRCGSMCVCVYVFLRPPPACGFICVLSFLCVVGVCVCLRGEVDSRLAGGLRPDPVPPCLHWHLT